MRSIDEPIPPDELLFRRIGSGDVDGDQVLYSAIDLPATSVNRQKYSRPEDVLTPSRPDQSGIAKLRVGDIPSGPVENPNGGNSWEFFAADVPEEGDAHAEVRLRRYGQQYSENNKPKGAFKLTLRIKLAEQMRVHSAPTVTGPS